MTRHDPQPAYDRASFSTPCTTTFHGRPDCPACGTGRLCLWHLGIAYDGGGSIDSYASKPPPAEPNFRYEIRLAVCRHADTDEPGCGFTLPLTQAMLGPHLVDLHQRQNIADYVARQTATRQEPS